MLFESIPDVRIFTLKYWLRKFNWKKKSGLLALVEKSFFANFLCQAYFSSKLPQCFDSFGQNVSIDGRFWISRSRHNILDCVWTECPLEYILLGSTHRWKFGNFRSFPSNPDSRRQSVVVCLCKTIHLCFPMLSVLAYAC